MRRFTLQSFVASAPRVSDEERRVAAVAGTAHALHDGYADLIYILLPLWQGEFALSYAALGALRGVFVGAMAALQIPAGFAADRFSAGGVLALGTALAGLGYCCAGLSTSFSALLGALLLCGLGAATQHPIASALVARAFAGPRSLKALGSYNFVGDLGKMTLPATLSLMLLAMPWRPALACLGGLGIAVAVGVYLKAPDYGSGDAARLPSGTATTRDTAGRRFGFIWLVTIGIIDSATRMGFLLFLPFVLTEKGASLQMVGLAMTMVFAGGAVGKLACAFIGARIGVIGTVWLTEGFTMAGILALIPLPLPAALLLLPAIGVALNGTSSVLYGSVPDLVAPNRRTRALSIFYTGTIGSGAVAPILFGRVGDIVGVWYALGCVAGLVLFTLPIAALLRGQMGSDDGP